MECITDYKTTDKNEHNRLDGVLSELFLSSSYSAAVIFIKCFIDQTSLKK